MYVHFNLAPFSVLYQELHEELERALGEIKSLNESRERQKEMVQAIINQRDMYRTLLAQSTPLPGDSSLSMALATPKGHVGMHQSAEVSQEGRDDSMVGVEAEEGAVVVARNALEEMKEQFAAYRKEKTENDSILQQQIGKLREEGSEVKIERAKLAAKVMRARIN